MADIIDTKYGTNLALAWTRADTKSANDLCPKFRGDYRYKTEGGDEAKAVEDEAWHAFIAFEARHHGIASLLNGPSYLAICVAKGNQAVSDCCHYAIFFARMGDRLHSSMTSVCTAPWGCSSGWTFGQLVLILDY